MIVQQIHRLEGPFAWARAHEEAERIISASLLCDPPQTFRAMTIATLNQELAKERHRNLTIWKEAMALVNDVYTTTKTFPKDEVWGLTSQIRRAGVSIASNIAEGSKRPDDDFRRFLSYSLGSLAELDTQLIIAEMQGYAPYAHEMKSRIIGLMAAIRKFAAALRK